MASLFAAVLGVNPVRHLLVPLGVSLPAKNLRVLAGNRFFPGLISGPFHSGLVVVFAVATALSVIAGVASLLRGGRYVHPETADKAEARANSSVR